MTVTVGIAGLGTVGAGLISLLVEDPRFTRMGLTFEIGGVSARNRRRERAVPVDGYRWFDDPVALATDPDIDVFVELMGGSDGPAKAATEAALGAGKAVVTANKALIAEHGAALAGMAEARGVPLKFEAAVAGGTPVVRGIREGAAACRVDALAGILNGTCNYVLSTMAETGADFDTVVREAQAAGFAEADPSFDVDGIDAAHKLSILATLAFDGLVPKDAMSVRGISDVTLADIASAKDLGRVIKLVAEARREGDYLALRVTPALVPNDHPFADAKGPGNAVTVKANPLGDLLFAGPGAGAGATASAVAADLCDVARGVTGPVFATAAANLSPLPVRSAGDLISPFFLRLSLRDEPGALAALAQTLATHGVSVAELQQRTATGGHALVTLVTHPVTAGAMSAAAEALSNAPTVEGRPSHLPLLNP